MLSLEPVCGRGGGDRGGQRWVAEVPRILVFRQFPLNVKLEPGRAGGAEGAGGAGGGITGAGGGRRKTS